MDLTRVEAEMLAGSHGKAVGLAMSLVVGVGRAEQAPHLVDVVSAHIDGCLYHGQAGLDFAERLVADGGKVAVPTTLNVSSLDLLHPELFRGSPALAQSGKALMDAYVNLGCLPTWTCAPYHLEQRPGLGDQIAWGESNAIVFANSVLGARTNRYGDFMDIACALTGKAPWYGLHTDEGRRASVRVEIDLPDHLLESDLTYNLVGHLLGRQVGQEVAVLTGLDTRASEDRLKALGAAAASSGSVAMFHVAGVTPEAPDLETVLVTDKAPRRVTFDVNSLAQARAELTTGSSALGAVSVGTPHMSLQQLRDLASRFDGRPSLVPFYANTGRDTYLKAAQEGVVEELERAAVRVVTDTCTYVTAIMGPVAGTLMTDSGKLAYYAPANLGVDVAIASIEDCVRSAQIGEMVIGELW